MEKITFVNDSAPPLNANYLNLLQTNIENSIDGVSGSNANGNFIKYDNGILIQWGNYDTGHKAFTTSYGNIYYDNTTHQINFPETFVGDRPTVSLTAYLPGGLGGANLRSEPSASSVNCYVYSVSSYTFSSNVKISWLAIGRWK